ncbi:MAG: virulence protein SciE type [Candidatus Angelobacter sp. Gp1-AA117]|nr:MAG: virulence protein SciE type [Candidatus Angelobacter sp. Gp1-AA117]
MTGMELFQSGKLQEAIRALGDEVRNAPLDARRRTFLFELLCFSGEYDRAEKHLDVLAGSSHAAGLGCLLYRSAIHAEKIRQRMFLDRSCPPPRPPANISGIRNGRPLETFSDADERIGASLEVFVAGSYTWIALEQIASIEVPEPRKLRDLLWTPASITPAPGFQSLELGEILLPVLCPLTWKHSDDSVRLGRSTVWEDGGNPEAPFIPFGQKLFLIDGQEVPILELGKIELAAVAGEKRAASA